MAKAIKFTNRSIAALPVPAQGRDEYLDTETPCLYLRVSATGVRTFSYFARAKGGKRMERVTIGRYSAVKAEEARAKAKQIAGRLADGESVAAATRAKRNELSLSELFTAYVREAESRNKRPDKLRALWRLYLADKWGQRRLSEIHFQEVGRWHRGMPAELNRKREAARKDREIAIANLQQPMRSRALRTTPTDGRRTANQALKLMHAIYRWAIEKARLYNGDNPAHGIELFKEMHRDRFLLPEEMRPFFQALAAEPNETMRDFFLLALLTGARRSNVLAMRWADLDLNRGEWRIPGSQMKNSEPQTVTLAPEAVQILKRRRRHELGDYVLTADSKSGHLAEPKGAWKRILTTAGIVNLRIHDLRRTLGSWQARTGASLVVIGKSLNHRSPQSTKVYAQLDLDPVRQSVERAASAILAAANEDASADVLSLRGVA